MLRSTHALRNCVLTVEAARYVAERLDRRLVLPLCHTSPLGEQACSLRADIPSQRQIIVPLVLPKVLQARDLSRCWRPASLAPAVLSTFDIPLSAAPRNVTCLEITPRSADRAVRLTQRRNTMGKPSPCESELQDDDELRSQLPIRFSSTVTINADVAFGVARQLPSAASLPNVYGASYSAGSVSSTSSLQPSPALQRLLPTGGDVFLHNAFGLFSKQLLGRMFGLCALPRETDGVVRMERALQRAVGLPRANTLCFHWRGEDFHHPTTLAKHRQSANDSSGVHVARRVEARARSLGVSNVLVLTNARHEALTSMLATLRAAGLRAESPRTLSESTFGCQARYVYGTVAEMLTCSRMRHFLGSARSSYSEHIFAMREAKGLNETTDTTLCC